MRRLFFLALITLYFSVSIAQTKNLQRATFGMGCFWCTEAVFKSLKGVYNVKSGYEGGHVPNPSYQEVTTGETGHAEVVTLQFDPNVITYKELLEIFWKIHDPTTLNRQGADVGTQYRSVIFYHNDEQKLLAHEYKNAIDKAKIYKNKIVTEITPTKTFYVAENYHQDYYNLNKENPYCKQVILPKLEKLESLFKSKLKGKR